MRRLLWDTDAEPVTDPVLALQRLTGRLEVMLGRLGEGINVLESLHAAGSPGVERVELVMWRHVARELRQALEAMTRYGIEDRVTAVLEQQGEQVAELVNAVGRAVLRDLVGLLQPHPGALAVVEAEFERVLNAAAFEQLGRAHELEVGAGS